MHFPIVHVVLTALSASVLWFGVYVYKKLGYELEIHKLRMKLVNEANAYASLYIQYELLKKLTGRSAPPPPTANVGKSTNEQALSILGLDTRAGAQEIKNKFRILVKKYHPDLNKSKEAALKFKKINEAYNILKSS